MPSKWLQSPTWRLLSANIGINLTMPPACCQVEMVTGRQAPGRADQVRQAGLPGFYPALIHPVAIADKDPLPVVDEGRKSFFGAVRVDHVECHGVTRHHPQPLEGIGEEPGRFIDI